MKTQIKNYGNSTVLVLSPEFMKFNNAKVGDWIDLSDAVIISEKLNELKEEQ
jgi:antitoxin component of MazEF toxin-antitoxin module